MKGVERERAAVRVHPAITITAGSNLNATKSRNLGLALVVIAELMVVLYTAIVVRPRAPLSEMSRSNRGRRAAPSETWARPGATPDFDWLTGAPLRYVRGPAARSGSGCRKCHSPGRWSSPSPWWAAS